MISEEQLMLRTDSKENELVNLNILETTQIYKKVQIINKGQTQYTVHCAYMNNNLR